MKIERRGTLPKQEKQEMTPQWWVGKKAECPQCHVVVTLELGDAPNHFTSFAMRCPTAGCGAYIPIRPVFDRSGKIQ